MGSKKKANKKKVFKDFKTIAGFGFLTLVLVGLAATVEKENKELKEALLDAEVENRIISEREEELVEDYFQYSYTTENVIDKVFEHKFIDSSEFWEARYKQNIRNMSTASVSMYDVLKEHEILEYKEDRLTKAIIAYEQDEVPPELDMLVPKGFEFPEEKLKTVRKAIRKSLDDKHELLKQFQKEVEVYKDRAHLICVNELQPRKLESKCLIE